MYKFEQNSIPLYIQLYEQIKDKIKTKLKAGTKLTSIRKLSNEYNLSKTTVQTAYNQLYAEGYIESRKNSGYFVCEDIFQNFQINKDEKTIRGWKQKAPALLELVKNGALLKKYTADNHEDLKRAESIFND